MHKNKIIIEKETKNARLPGILLLTTIFLYIVSVLIVVLSGYLTISSGLITIFVIYILDTLLFFIFYSKNLSFLCIPIIYYAFAYTITTLAEISESSVFSTLHGFSFVFLSVFFIIYILRIIKNKNIVKRIMVILFAIYIAGGLFSLVLYLQLPDFDFKDFLYNILMQFSFVIYNLSLYQIIKLSTIKITKQPETETPKTEYTSYKIDKNHCQYCGSKLKEDESYCIKCGAPAKLTEIQ